MWALATAVIAALVITGVAVVFAGGDEEAGGDIAGVPVGFSATGTLITFDETRYRFWTGTGERMQETGAALTVADTPSEVTVSRDGEMLAALCHCDGNYGKVAVIEIVTQTQRCETTGGDYQVAISPDGSALATGSSSGFVTLWSTQDCRQLGSPLEWNDDLNNVLAVAFAPDGTLASSGTDRYLALWDRDTGELLQRVNTGHDSNVGSIEFSPDGAVIATSAWDSLQLWDSETLDPIGQPIPLTSEAPPEVAFSPDGSSIAVIAFSPMGRESDNGWNLRLYDVATRQQQGDPVATVDAVFAPDGQWMAIRPPDTFTTRLIRVPS